MLKRSLWAILLVLLCVLGAQQIGLRYRPPQPQKPSPVETSVVWAAPQQGSDSAAAERLLQQILSDGQVNERALENIAEQGNAARTASAYFLAGRYEYEHKRVESGLRYAQRALDFAPNEPGIHLLNAVLLIESTRYTEAAQQAEQAVTLDPKSAEAERVLGYAYYNDRQLWRAIDAWQRALELKPDNADLRSALEKAQREMTVEERFAETTDGHFVLRYEGGTPVRELSDELFRSLERSYSKISQDLDSAPGGSILVTIYSRQQFFDVTQAPSWAGAINDGQLRIPLGDVSTVTPQIEGVLRHELTHWFVHSMVRNCPVWLNEGLAMIEEGRSISDFSPEVRQRLRAGEGAPLHHLEGQFLSMGRDEAQLAYARSLVATEYLKSSYGMEGLRKVLTLINEGQSTESALHAVTGGGYAELEQNLSVAPGR